MFRATVGLSEMHNGGQSDFLTHSIGMGLRIDQMPTLPGPEIRGRGRLVWVTELEDWVMTPQGRCP